MPKRASYPLIALVLLWGLDPVMAAGAASAVAMIMAAEPTKNGNGYIIVPKWFVSFLSFLSSVVCVGAVFWAWSISADVSAIKAEVKAQSELRRSELEDVRRRLDRHDELLDKLLDRRSL